MKRLLLMLLLVLPIMGGFAYGDTKSSLVKNALKVGPNSDGYYHIDNPKDKVVTLDELKQYISSQGYYYLNGASKKLDRFGSLIYAFSYVNFIDINNYQTYVFRRLSYDQTPLSALSKKGTVFLQEDEKRYKPVFIFKVFDDYVPWLHRYDNVLWSGNVVDGYIDGTGTGLIILDGGVYKTFRGTYKRGIPASDITSKSVTRENPRSNPFIKSEDIETRNLRALDVGMSLCNLETKDPYLKNALVEFLKKDYNEDVKKVDDCYNSIKTLKRSQLDEFFNKYSKFKYSCESYLQRYGAVDYDPQKMFPKAQTVIDMYKIQDMMSLYDKPVLYSTRNWLGQRSATWDMKEFKRYIETLDTGMQVVWKYMYSDDQAIRPIFSEISTELAEKDDRIRNKIRSDYEEYLALKAKEGAEYDKWYSENKNVVDRGETYSPSGELVLTSFGSSEYEYDNYGKISNKAIDDYVTYNAFFDGNKNFKYYQILYCSPKIAKKLDFNAYSKKFKSESELQDAVLKAISQL